MHLVKGIVHATLWAFMARSCRHELWARFQGFVNDGHLMRVLALGVQLERGEILLQQQKWCMQGGAEVERKGTVGIGTKG